MQAPEWPWDRTEAGLALRSCVQAELEQLVAMSCVPDGGLLTQARDNSLWHSRGKAGGSMQVGENLKRASLGTRVKGTTQLWPEAPQEAVRSVLFAQAFSLT